MRIKAQLELQKFPRYTRPAAIRNRCIESGKARVRIKKPKKRGAGSLISSVDQPCGGMAVGREK